RVVAVRVVHRCLSGADRSASSIARLARRAGGAAPGFVAQARRIAGGALFAGAHLGVSHLRQAAARAGAGGSESVDAAAPAAAHAAQELPRAVEGSCPPARS